MMINAQAHQRAEKDPPIVRDLSREVISPGQIRTEAEVSPEVELADRVPRSPKELAELRTQANPAGTISDRYQTIEDARDFGSPRCLTAIDAINSWGIITEQRQVDLILTLFQHAASRHLCPGPELDTLRPAFGTRPSNGIAESLRKQVEELYRLEYSPDYRHALRALTLSGDKESLQLLKRIAEQDFFRPVTFDEAYDAAGLWKHAAQGGIFGAIHQSVKAAVGNPVWGFFVACGISIAAGMVLFPLALSYVRKEKRRISNPDMAQCARQLLEELGEGRSHGNSASMG